MAAIQGVRGLAWTTACFFIGIVILLRGDMTHYTWWMVTEFWTVTLLASTDLDHLFAITFLVQNVLVIIGVVAMSAMGCSMLRDTANELGWAYIPLNFLVHYLPSLVVIGFPPRKPIRTFVEQVVIGISLFVSYALVNNAISVYGCSFRRGVVPLIFTLASLAVIPLQPHIEKALSPVNYATYRK